MSESSRRKILERLNNTETREEEKSSSSGFYFLKKYDQPILETFKQKFKAVNGKFIFCNNFEDLENALLKILDEKQQSEFGCIETNIIKLFSTSINNRFTEDINTETFITGCEYLVAQTGSAILSTAQTRSRKTFAYPPTHVVIAFKNQLIHHLEEGLDLIKEKYGKTLPSQITTITGPSRTADIEKTLVLGAHGPKELIILYLDVDLE